MIDAITRDQVILIIKSMTDESWWGPLEEAGVGQGWELIDLIGEIWASISTEIHNFSREMHASYAGEGLIATTTLTFSRTYTYAQVVPAGTKVWTPWGLPFILSAEVNWADSENDDREVEAIALGYGAAYNVGPDTIRELRVPSASGLGDETITVTNVEAATGGQLQTLDLIASDELIYRADGESNDSVRDRIRGHDDSVTPNAIKRTVSSILSPLGLNVEPSDEGCAYQYIDGFDAGMFLDEDAYLDAGQEETDPHFGRFSMMLLDQHDTHRSFFVVVPLIVASESEYGFTLDEGGYDQDSALDGEEGHGFLDGSDLLGDGVYASIWNSINLKKPAGFRATLIGQWTL